jgi:hypothetical protein
MTEIDEVRLVNFWRTHPSTFATGFRIKGVEFTGKSAGSMF